MSFIVKVDPKWFAEQVVEYIMGGKDPADVIADEFSRAMKADADRMRQELLRFVPRP